MEYISYKSSTDVDTLMWKSYQNQFTGIYSEGGKTDNIFEKCVSKFLTPDRGGEQEKCRLMIEYHSIAEYLNTIIQNITSCKTPWME